MEDHGGRGGGGSKSRRLFPKPLGNVATSVTAALGRGTFLLCIPALKAGSGFGVPPLGGDRKGGVSLLAAKGGTPNCVSLEAEEAQASCARTESGGCRYVENLYRAGPQISVSSVPSVQIFRTLLSAPHRREFCCSSPLAPPRSRGLAIRPPLAPVWSPFPVFRFPHASSSFGMPVCEAPGFLRSSPCALPTQSATRRTRTRSPPP